ncbi:AraC family transcriptional regulator [Aquirufa aurantiipilula]|uniref:AraC family transcriptional regulator n=1 Tax=Aquirufa aurantiipilula TaxID=2696561 RepID=UPI001CAA524B|nr:helix-turn-helix domain-containing protein [Aquirufa aurantiipilula]MBZ1326638.1 AraC family transcriptional regulator [Aquirufa aurantiipilula]
MFLTLPFLSLLFSIIIAYFNIKKNRGIIFLSIFYFLIGVISLKYYLFTYDSQLPWLLAILYGHFSPLFFLIGPAAYIYVRNTVTDQEGLSQKDIWHLIPSLYMIVGLIPYFLKPYQDKLALVTKILNQPGELYTNQIHLFSPSLVNDFVRNFLYVYYAWLMIMLLIKSSETKETESVDSYEMQKRITFQWLIIFVSFNTFIASILLSSNFVVLFSPERDFSNLNDYLPYYRILIMFAFVMPLLILLFPRVLYGIPQLTVEELELIQTKKRKSNSEKTELDVDDSFYELSQIILNYIETDKPYLNPRFSIRDIVVTLNIPQHHVSYCFNKILNTPFPTIKNKYRIEYVKELIIKDKEKRFSLEGLMKEAGFTSKNSFFQAFKEIEGCTPKVWSEQQKAD